MPTVQTLTVKLSQIEPDRVLLRDKVEKNKEEWTNFVKDIRQHGILQSLNARVDPENPERYIIIDGFHRWSALIEIAEETGEDPEVPIIVGQYGTAMEVLTAQARANSQRIETKPVQYSRHIQRMFAMDTTLTQRDVAELLNWSVSKVSQILKLANLPEDIGNLVDENELPLAKAYHLAKLPSDELESGDWVNRAMDSDPADLAAEISQTLNDIKAKRPRRDPNEVMLTPSFRTKAEAINELERVAQAAEQEGLTDDSYSDLVDESNINFRAGFLQALRWVLKVDAETLAEKEAEARARAEKKAREKAEKDRAKAADKAAASAIAPTGPVTPKGFERDNAEVPV